MALRGWVVAIEGFPLSTKARLRTLLASGGAEYAYSISPKVTHLLLQEGEPISSYKDSQLRSWDIKVIHDLPESIRRDVVALDVFNVPNHIFASIPSVFSATAESAASPSTLPSALKSPNSFAAKKVVPAPSATKASVRTEPHVPRVHSKITVPVRTPTTSNIKAMVLPVNLPAPPAPRAVKSQMRSKAVAAVTAEDQSAVVARLSTQRSVRLFVSSTFADMKAEREYLVSVVFPEIRASCAARHIEFSFVDMRWGITDEMTAGGESTSSFPLGIFTFLRNWTIAACLKEIDTCRPFFIGLLGNRYGWCDPANADHRFQLSLQKAVDAGFDWVRRFADRSVTELEMLYGALLPALAPPSTSSPTSASPSPLFFIRSGADQHEISGAESVRLSDLHNRVRAGFAYSEYSQVQQLGELVQAQILTAIALRYPPESDPSAADMENEAHEKCAREHETAYVSAGTIGARGASSPARQLELDVLDWVTKSNQPAILTGASGSGKSALLSHLLFALRAARPKDLIIPHFVGHTDQSSDYVTLMRRIVALLADHFSAPADLPEEPDAVADAFRQWINGLSVGAAARKRAVILLDGLDHLQMVAGSADMHWLPARLPSNVSLIVSAAPGSCFDILSSAHRNWRVFEMQALNLEEKQALVERTLSRVGKKLDVDSSNKLSSQNMSPLYLRTVLSELCAIGVYDQLKQQLANYLAARDITSLFTAVVQRWETSFSTLLPVKEVLLAIAGARHGAAEFEILKALNIPNRPWSTFFAAVKDFLPIKGGLLTFAHKSLKDAVLFRFPGALLLQVRLKMCKYFEEDPSLTARKVLELPYLLELCNEQQRLKKFFSDLRVFAFLFEPDETRYEFIRLWRYIGDGEVFPAVTSYRTALSALGTDSAQREAYSRMYFLVGDFCRETSQNEASMEFFLQALKLQDGLMKEAASAPIDDQRKLARPLVETLDGLCSMAKRLERYNEGVAYGERAAAIGEEYLGRYSSCLIDVYADLAAVLGKMNKLGEAEAAARKAMLVATQKGEQHYDAATAYHNLAIILKKQKRYEEAEQYYLLAIEIRKRALGPTHLLTSHSTTNLANFYNKTSRFDEAEKLHREAMAIVSATFGNQSPDYAQCMFNLANCLLTRTEDTWKIGDDASRLDEATTLLDSTLAIAERVYGIAHELSRNTRTVQRGVKTMELVIDKTYHPEKYIAIEVVIVKPTIDIDLEFCAKEDRDIDMDQDEDQDMGFGLFD